MVHKYSDNDIIELYELWQMTEVFGVPISSEHSNPENKSKLKNVLNKMKGSVENIEYYRELNQEYHQLLMDCCPNQKLKELHTKILKQIHWFMNITISNHPEPKISYNSHLKIYNLFVNKMGKELENQVKEHVIMAGERLRKEIKGRLGKILH